MIPTGRHRILQVHPTLRCNLRCSHCYSNSAPEIRTSLNPDLLIQALTEAKQEGYTVVGFSGGEPVLYPFLDRLLMHAKDLGQVTTVTTNGTLLSGRPLRWLALADLIAISLDGVPESHDRIRGPGAFDALMRGLPRLRGMGIPFGFIFTLRNSNVHEIAWVAKFASSQGARLLQVHPLEEVGRAAHLHVGNRPESLTLGLALVEILRLQEEVGEDLRLHLDVATVESIRALADVLPSDRSEARLADIVSPLVIESDGTVVPLQYGFPRRFQLGNLEAASLREMAALWLRHKRSQYRHLFVEMEREVSFHERIPLVNWYQLVEKIAQASPEVGCVSKRQQEATT